MAWIDIFKKKAEEQDRQEKTDPSLHISSTGTEIYSGYLEEEFLGELRNTRHRYEEYHRMRSSSGVIQMCVKSVQNPLRSATWDFRVKEGYEHDARAQKQVEMLRKLVSKKHLRRYVTDLSTAVIFGFSILERFYKLKVVDGQLRLCPKLKFISQRTVEKWMIDIESNFVGVEQQPFGDSALDKTVNIFISSHRLVHFAVGQEGDNYEGISLLRPIYGNWVRKNVNFKKIAVGNTFLSIPFLKIFQEGDGKLKQDDLQKFENRLKQRSSEDRQLSHIVFPKGFKAEEQSTQFDPQKLYQCNDQEDIEIIRNFLCNFLLLTKGTGSFALSENLSKFFLNSIELYAKDIDGILTRGLVEPAIEVNLNEECMVEVFHSEIGAKGGPQLAEALAKLTSSKAVIPDDKLEDWTRKKFEMPEADIETQREMSPPMPIPPGQPGMVDEAENDDEDEGGDDDDESERERQREERATPSGFKRQAQQSVSRIKTTRETLTRGLQDGLMEVTNAKLKKIKTYLSKTEGKQAAYKIRPENFAVSTSKLKKQAGEILTTAYDQEKASLSGYISMAKRTGNTDKKMIDALIGADIDDIITKIDNSVLYSLLDSLDVITDLDRIIDILEKTVTSIVIGKAVADKVSVAPSKAVNIARQQVFEERSEEIESFTYYNPSPVAEICKYLKGKTISATDPQLNQYQPPLHYNCATVMLPNMKQFKKNPKPKPLTPNQKQVESINIGVKSGV